MLSNKKIQFDIFYNLRDRRFNLSAHLLSNNYGTSELHILRPPTRGGGAIENFTTSSFKTAG